MPPNGKDEDDLPEPQRPPSPPIHTTFATRGILPPNFPALKPRDIRYHSHQAMTHVAWSCNGKRLAAVGIDKTTRVWFPEKGMELKQAATFSGAHSDDVDYVSWNPTHPDLFCTSSQKDRRIVFWDARQTRNIQQCSLKVSPVQTNYSPDGRTLLYTSVGNQLFFLTLGKENEEAKEMWHPAPKDPVVGSTAVFNHAGDGVVLTHNTEHSLRIIDYPSLALRENYAAHVGGCVAVALDPRGRYLASGGHDSIVNVFDLSESICVRTITSCENSINGISFSHDGEYLAIANSGTYVDICATETGASMHRVPALAPAPTVAWHPSKYIVAYCGQTRLREGGPPPMAVVSLFGLTDA
ncbi:WD40-repeat-containing domain protein [Roridomyces roridus]|uniref:WD40-repeat-containing domain protein n=1 Tax=Roridomyces roridus TaxID=1738132 RepID=A0AAD7C5N7_9AGAR|nr:WD40-repeat-containing domain protein [Roridomyces roridus]